MIRVLVIANGTDGCGLMAAAYLRRMTMDRGVEVVNAGFVEQPVDERVLKLLLEDRFAVPDHAASLVEMHMGEPFDIVITLSDDVRGRAPLIPCTTKLHRHFPDPADMGDSKAGIREMYRVRNELKLFCAKVAADLLIPR